MSAPNPPDQPTSPAAIRGRAIGLRLLAAAVALSGGAVALIVAIMLLRSVLG